MGPPVYFAYQQTDERKAREAAEKAAEEEAKRRLEAVEENLILKGAI